MMKQVGLSLAILGLMLGGCGGGQGANQTPENANQAAENRTATENPTAASDRAARDAVAESSQSSDPDSLIQEALDRFIRGDAYAELASYRLVLETQQTVFADGSNAESRSRYEEAQVSDVRQVIVQGDGEQPANETYFSGDTVYQVAGDQCQTTTLDRESFELAMGMGRGMMAMGIALALGGQAELVATSETINGVTVDQYRIIQDDVSIELDTDVWLSQTDGYLVKLASRTTIPNALEMRTTVDLSEVNSLGTIAIPAVCTT